VNAYDSIDPSRLSTVIAMNDYGQMYDYDLHDYQGRVRFQIDADDFDSYIQAAEAVNRTRLQVVNIQHEYGLYGGEDGEYILEFMRRVNAPIVLTMHTVIPEPRGHFQEVTQRMLDVASSVVVLANAAVPLIMDNYDLPSERLHVIPHGIPNFTRKEAIRRRTKKLLGFGERPLLSTFGLISPSKAIEYVIEALPAIVERHPDVLYLVIGETHPHIRKREGESYRNYLTDLAQRLGVQRHVRFNNRFLSNSELIRYLAATDVYIMAYLNKDQIVSGTLAYAVGCGKAVVATPFVYAQEMLADGRGIIVPFKDSQAIAGAVNALLGDRKKLLQMEERAYKFSRPMVWPNVARMYLELFRYVAYFRAPVHAAR
jgi:glycosyltransferase involved in cell wall biosynthesis